MNITELSPKTLHQLAVEGDADYESWIESTHGVSVRSREQVSQKELWRLAYSKGCSAVLRRVDKLKEI